MAFRNKHLDDVERLEHIKVWERIEHFQRVQRDLNEELSVLRARINSSWTSISHAIPIENEYAIILHIQQLDVDHESIRQLKVLHNFISTYTEYVPVTENLNNESNSDDTEYLPPDDLRLSEDDLEAATSAILADKCMERVNLMYEVIYQQCSATQVSLERIEKERSPKTQAWMKNMHFLYKIWEELSASLKPIWVMIREITRHKYQLGLAMCIEVLKQTKCCIENATRICHDTLCNMFKHDQIDEVLRSVLETITAMIVQETPEEAVSLQNEIQPVSSGNKVQHVSLKNKIHPVSSKKEIRIVSSRKEIQPVSSKKEIQPSSRKKILLVSSRKKILLVSSRKKILLISSRKKNQPVSLGKEIPSVSSKMESLPVSSEEEEITPISSKKKLLSASSKKEIQPVSSSNEIQCVSLRNKIQPVSSRNKIQHASLRKKIRPVSLQKEIPSVSSKMEIPPVSSKIEILPVSSEEEEILPVSLEKEIPPVSVKEEIPPVSVKEEIPPVSVKEEIPPVSSETGTEYIPLETKIKEICSEIQNLFSSDAKKAMKHNAEIFKEVLRLLNEYLEELNLRCQGIKVWMDRAIHDKNSAWLNLFIRYKKVVNDVIEKTKVVCDVVSSAFKILQRYSSGSVSDAVQALKDIADDISRKKHAQVGHVGESFIVKVKFVNYTAV